MLSKVPTGPKKKDLKKNNCQEDNSKVYRHIFFKDNILQNVNGFITVKYTGQMYSNCGKMKDFTKKFDRNRDLLISCNDCAKRMYKNFVKISPEK